MADEPSAIVPDIYADGVSVGTGPYGTTVTFFVSEPMRPVGDTGLPGRIVGHVRMSGTLARDFAKSLLASLENVREPVLQIEREGEPSDADG